MTIGRGLGADGECAAEAFVLSGGADPNAVFGMIDVPADGVGQERRIDEQPAQGDGVPSRPGVRFGSPHQQRQ